MSAAFEIRPVLLSDIDGIQKVAKLTWNQTYGTIYTKEYITSFVERAYSYQSLEAAVTRDEKRSIRKFIVAHCEEEVVGYAQLTETKDGEAELSRIYVLPGYQGSGIGKALLQKLLKPDITLTRVFAWVERENHTGTRFYKANKFRLIEHQEEIVDGQIVRLSKYIKEVEKS